MASKIVEEYGDIRAAEASKQGIQQGEERKAIEAVIGLHENNVPVDIIAKSLKMTEEKVKEIVSTPAAQ